MIPGETACFNCATPLAVVENNEGDIKREGVCAASLPTTMGITAGFMAQNTLKFLLEFGELAFCLNYNAKLDFFQNFRINPNPECKDKECVKKQIEKNNGLENFLSGREKKFMQKIEEEKKNTILHKENNWGIEIVQDNKLDEPEKIIEISEEERKNENIEDLMSKLKGL